MGQGWFSCKRGSQGLPTSSSRATRRVSVSWRNWCATLPEQCHSLTSTHTPFQARCDTCKLRVFSGRSVTASARVSMVEYSDCREETTRPVCSRKSRNLKRVRQSNSRAGHFANWVPLTARPDTATAKTTTPSESLRQAEKQFDRFGKIIRSSWASLAITKTVAFAHEAHRLILQCSPGCRR